MKSASRGASFASCWRKASTDAGMLLKWEGEVTLRLVPPASVILETPKRTLTLDVDRDEITVLRETTERMEAGAWIMEVTAILRVNAEVIVRIGPFNDEDAIRPILSAVHAIESLRDQRRHARARESWQKRDEKR